MSKQANRCYDCWHYQAASRGKPCAKGHKPRWYLWPDPHDAGYRRRCDDFVPAMVIGGKGDT